MQNLTKIKQATIADIPTIQAIAEQTWRPTYGEILTEEQTLFMLDMMYSTASLTKQFETNSFILIGDDTQWLGYAGFEPKNGQVMKLHKIYLLPQTQGKGLGKALIEEVVKITQEKGLSIIELNVNRNNKAIGFYQKNGFQIVDEVDINIGNGYWMNDFVMHKVIEQA